MSFFILNFLKMDVLNIKLSEASQIFKFHTNIEENTQEKSTPKIKICEINKSDSVIKYEEVINKLNNNNNQAYIDKVLKDYKKDTVESLITKIPTDGLTGKSDEDNFGFTYEQLDTWLKNDGDCGDKTISNKIMKLYKQSEHKRMPPILYTQSWFLD